MKAARVANAEVEHLALVADENSTAVVICGQHGFFPVIEFVDATVLLRTRLPLCTDCAEVMHDLTLLEVDTP